MGTDIHGVFQKKDRNKWMDVPSLYEQKRHYLLFAWLGDIRNGYGFAGVPTHTPIEPIAADRGIPDDFIVDKEEMHPLESIDHIPLWMHKWHEADEKLEIWMGDHSHSWVLGSEIVAATLPMIERSGVVEKGLFDKWDGKTTPDSYCNDICGLDVYVDAPEDVSDKTTHVRIAWAEDPMEEVRYFTDEVRRLMSRHDEVRFVFGFDR